MARPLDDCSPEASSSTAAEKPVSALRARLCSEDPFHLAHASASSSEPHRRHSDIYKQLRAAFSSVSGPRPAPAPHHSPDGGRFIMNNLAETFARCGEETYKSVACNLEAVHRSLSGQIDAFHAESAATLSDAAALYENISYPLSMTVCHSGRFPRGTIEQHLSALRDKMAAAEEELASLDAEWTACVAEEAKAMTATAADDDPDPSKDVDALVHEIDGIVRDKAADLDHMDKVSEPSAVRPAPPGGLTSSKKYRDLLWRESQKVMKAIVAD
ncbi:uncharacterized protein MAM_07265 [Metarhizium album ARSEF 1941]|uniref:Uncharacterized protein n=1 Tax=Metarhizium album (strain ARSEF 1941) TaxID=1081103 RepID=A0A0B2WFV9_METAS|nr:uncharacterized protein MAM_07265 [Metarhizium album ARSEF 1941]KHN94846.1 hypothetical protein MAM_07265 [Metarhizium album ARSEF 1941]